MKRILLATDYPQLTELSLYNAEVNRLESLLSGKLFDSVKTIEYCTFYLMSKQMCIDIIVNMNR